MYESTLPIIRAIVPSTWRERALISTSENPIAGTADWTDARIDVVKSSLQI